MPGGRSEVVARLDRLPGGAGAGDAGSGAGATGNPVGGENAEEGAAQLEVLRQAVAWSQSEAARRGVPVECHSLLQDPPCAPLPQPTAGGGSFVDYRTEAVTGKAIAPQELSTALRGVRSIFGRDRPRKNQRPGRRPKNTFATGETLAHCSCHQGRAVAVRFRPGAVSLASCGCGGTLKLCTTLQTGPIGGLPPPRAYLTHLLSPSNLESSFFSRKR